MNTLPAILMVDDNPTNLYLLKAMLNHTALHRDRLGRRLSLRPRWRLGTRVIALHVRLTAGFAVLLGLVGFALLALLSRTSDRYADEVRQRLDAGISMYVVRELALIEGGHVNQAAVRTLANRAMTVNPSAEVYLLDPAGRILVTVVQHDRLARSRIGLAPIQEFLRAPEHRPLYGDDPGSTEGRRVFSVAPIGERGHVVGIST